MEAARALLILPDGSRRSGRLIRRNLQMEERNADLTLHEDKKGLNATGKEQSYWICETSRLRVQEGRDKPMALFVRREKKVKWFNAQEGYGFITHLFHSCYNYMSEAVQAAEALETAT